MSLGVWLIEILVLSLGATILVEEGAGWLFGIRNSRDRILILLVNLLTNPAVVFLYYVNLVYVRKNEALATALLELSAVVIEGYCYKKAGKDISHPWLLSLVLNLISYGTGIAVRYCM